MSYTIGKVKQKTTSFFYNYHKGDITYQTSTLGYHLGRYLGQDGVKALVNDPACEDPDAVNWDDERVLKALKDYEDFAAKE